MTYHMFDWKRETEQAYAVSSPIQVLRHTLHRANLRMHICSECFAPIHIGERYTCTVYKDCESGKISQFKTHVVCPYEV